MHASVRWLKFHPPGVYPERSEGSGDERQILRRCAPQDIVGLAAGNRRNEGHFVTVAQNLVGGDVALVDGGHRRALVAGELAMLRTEPVPDIACSRSFRQIESLLALAGN